VALFNSEVNAKTFAIDSGNEAGLVCRHDRLLGFYSLEHCEKDLCIRYARMQSIYRVSQKSLDTRGNLLNVECKGTFVASGLRCMKTIAGASHL
jgi:hypothetical protein